MSESESSTVVNGASPQSTTLRHLLTLPAVQDGVRAFSANPVGQMSIQLSNSAYNLAAPVLSLFNKPLAYVTPYAQRVDEIGEQTLSKVVEKYPVVKKPSPELLQDAREAAYRPVQHVTQHVTEVYQGAYQRSAGAHTVASGKAAVKTAVALSLKSTIYAIREAVRLGESLHITESLIGALDRIEYAAYGTYVDDVGQNGNAQGQGQGQAQGQHAPAQATPGTQGSGAQAGGTNADPASK